MTELTRQHVEAMLADCERYQVGPDVTLLCRSWLALRGEIDENFDALLAKDQEIVRLRDYKRDTQQYLLHLEAALKAKDEEIARLGLRQSPPGEHWSDPRSDDDGS